MLRETHLELELEQQKIELNQVTIQKNKYRKAVVVCRKEEYFENALNQHENLRKKYQSIKKNISDINIMLDYIKEIPYNRAIDMDRAVVMFLWYAKHYFPREIILLIIKYYLKSLEWVKISDYYLHKRK